MRRRHCQARWLWRGSFAGMFIGQTVRTRMQPEAFRRWFLIAMIMLGISTRGQRRLSYFVYRQKLSAARVPQLSEQWRAGHEGVERGPELRAVAVLFLQDFMFRAGDDEMRAGAQMIGELLDGAVNHYFRDRLMALPEIAEYLDLIAKRTE